MSVDVMKERGVPLDRQLFNWREMVEAPVSKLNDDAFTRVRIILMNGIESEAIRFSHSAARMNASLQLELARIRRIEQHHQTTVNWLLPADLSPLETTYGFEQTAIEVTAALAQHEPDEYLAAAYRFGLLEDFDHLYRFAALGDRLFGLDVNNLLQGYTDVVPGRPTKLEHRAPADDLRKPYDTTRAKPLTKLNAMTLVAAEHQVHDYYMSIGPQFADPMARLLYAEIASIEEQHVTHYESLVDPSETWLEKWLLHELCEVYNYYSCYEAEPNERVKALWLRFCEYELGQFHHVRELFQRIERRDPEEVIARTLPQPIAYESQRKFVRDTLNREVHLRACGPQFTDQEISDASVAYREQLNRLGSPSEVVAAGYQYRPGTELAKVKVGVPDEREEGARP